MSEGIPRVAVAVVALAGVGIASYLSYTRLTDTAIICPTTGCGTVQRSTYAELAGIPVAYLGALGYAAIVATTFVARRGSRAAGVLLALAAAAFALYLLVAQLAFIGATCVWCLASDAVAAALVVLTVWRLRTAATRSTRRP